ncbi:MAG TPA: hypothetical protein VEL76_39165 [Gemmataceae bacterium]|nr:hypothetical protein [Gemmataceae bacterium]
MSIRQLLLVPFLGMLLLASAMAQPSLRSGLPPGQRPGPYSALVSTGPQRGQAHCFICETEDRPAVIVFARNLSDPLGKLAHQLDKALAEHKPAELRGWITFLAEDHTSLDKKVVAWAQQHAVSVLPLAVFEDVVGPPSYRLARDADVTVLLSVKQKVVANFAFRAGELNDARMAEVMKALPQITAKQ